MDKRIEHYIRIGHILGFYRDLLWNEDFGSPLPYIEDPIRVM